jgi:hypothetical protein
MSSEELKRRMMEAERLQAEAGAKKLGKGEAMRRAGKGEKAHRPKKKASTTYKRPLHGGKPFVSGGAKVTKKAPKKKQKASLTPGMRAVRAAERPQTKTRRVVTAKAAKRAAPKVARATARGFVSRVRRKLKKAFPRRR